MRLVLSDTVGGEANTVIVKGCRGSRFRFEVAAGGTHSAYPGVWATLTATQETTPTYYLQGVDHSTYVFDHQGLLQEIRDSKGHALTLAYTEGQLSRVRDATGERFLSFQYNEQGRLVAVRDPISRTVRFGYVGAELTTVTDTMMQAWTYVYSGTHLLHEVRDPLDHVVERTEYDAEGRAVRQWDGILDGSLEIEYGSPASGTAVITDAEGHVTLNWYSGFGALGWQSDTVGTGYRTYDPDFSWSSITDGNGEVTRYAFNAMGLPEEVTDPLGHVTRMQYDALNHLTAVTDALSNTTWYKYDGNLLITATDALGGLVANTYQDGLLTRVVDHGITTTYEYDDLGQRVAITDVLGHVTTYGYDQVGRLITTTIPDGQVTVNVYDNADRLVRVMRNVTSTTTSRTT